jgi:asparagine synthase (glutamine-hydrolysing)
VNVSTDPVALFDTLGDVCWFNDEPPAAVSSLAHMELMKRAKGTGIKVLLTGQGADEQLGGYNKFLYFYLYDLMRHHRYLMAAKTLASFGVKSNTLYEFRVSEAVRYLGRKRLSERTFIASGHQHYDAVDIGFQGSYARREWIDVTRTSIPALLHAEDRLSMSQSLEMRVPFLDYRLVELLGQMNPDEKFEGGRTKSIFRKAIKGLVPEEIRHRRDKKGFNVPVDTWMRGPFEPRVSDTFNAPLLSESLGFVDARRLNDAYTRFKGRKGYLNGRHFFRAYAFELFLRRYESSILPAQRFTSHCEPVSPHA